MRKLSAADLKDFLDQKVFEYNQKKFIVEDPVSIPHNFSKKEDIEIAAFLSASIAWGQRTVIIKNANLLLSRMDYDPHRFIMNFTPKDLKPFTSFVHRTFNGIDCVFFLNALQKIYKEKSSIESLFTEKTDAQNQSDYGTAIEGWRTFFFSIPHPYRTQKHFAQPSRGSAAKRINMFLRWMIRKDKAGVDFGIWNLPSQMLTCPLDVHSGRVARKLGLLKRKQDDWTAATELTNRLKEFDKDDPVKYDFALFGLGVFEKF